MSEDMKKNNAENNEIISADEFAVAEKEAKERQGFDTYTHKFRKPFTYEGKTYEDLTFEWDKLSGNDYLAIEGEMAALGKVLIAPEFSGDFIVRMIAKACTEKIGSDIIGAMPLCDFNKIRKEARSFLMNSVS